MAEINTLSNLKKEIEERKQQRGTVTEGTTANLSARDEFLHGLLTSIKTGTPTSATNKIKMVENLTAEKQGEIKMHNIGDGLTQSSIPAAPVNGRQNPPTVDMGGMMNERDDKFDQAISSKSQTLVEELNRYRTMGNVGDPMTTNQKPQQRVEPRQAINEGALVESVQGIVDNYLSQNFALLLEEAIKNTILELYATERVKEIIQENPEVVKKVVLETIREIQAKSKKKAE